MINVTFGFMKKHSGPQSYTFTYDGDFKSLNALTVLHTQINFVHIISEIKAHKYPEIELDFRISGTKEGSLNIEHMLDIASISGMFVIENYAYISTVFKLFKDLISIKKFLGEKKAENVSAKGHDQIVIQLNGDNITVAKDAFSIYQNSPIIANSLNNTGKILSENEDVDHVEITETKTKKKVVSINKKDFESLKADNPYLARINDKQEMMGQTLFIKKPNLIPDSGKQWIWDMVHRGRDVKAIILDKKLEKQINEGLKVGQGDRLIADIRIHYKFDEALQTFIETGKCEVMKVIKLIDRPRSRELPLGDSQE